MSSHPWNTRIVAIQDKLLLIGDTFVYKMPFLGMAKCPPIGGWLFIAGSTVYIFKKLIYKFIGDCFRSSYPWFPSVFLDRGKSLALLLWLGYFISNNTSAENTLVYKTVIRVWQDSQQCCLSFSNIFFQIQFICLCSFSLVPGKIQNLSWKSHGISWFFILSNVYEPLISL